MLSHPEAIAPRMLKRPMMAMVQPASSAERPRSIRYAGRCTVMKKSWNPQVKKPSTRNI